MDAAQRDFRMLVANGKLEGPLTERDYAEIKLLPVTRSLLFFKVVAQLG